MPTELGLATDTAPGRETRVDAHRRVIPVRVNMTKALSSSRPGRWLKI